MKATDLMIGDWVYCHHPSLPKEAIRVERGLINNLDWQNQGHIKEGDTLYREVEPIPLTPEILVQNGFVEKEGYDSERRFEWVSEDERTEVKVWLYTADEVVTADVWKNVYYEDEVHYSLPQPHYVHELQHALKLCGIAKTIEV